MQMINTVGPVLIAVLTSACANPNAPTYLTPVADCQYYGTGTLVLVNLAETLTPRDVYVDGRYVGLVPYGHQIVLTVDAGVVHLVEWVSVFSGASVDSVRLALPPCSTYTFTNDF